MKFMPFYSAALWISLVVASLLFQSCSEMEAWPVGTWTGTTGEGISFTEHWEVEGDGFIGWGKFEAEEKGENLALIKSNGSWLYQATVPNQNAGKTILFELKEAHQNQWTFINKSHDFPEFIRYERFHADSLKIEIGKDEQVAMVMKLSKVE